MKRTTPFHYLLLCLLVLSGSVFASVTEDKEECKDKCQYKDFKDIVVPVKRNHFEILGALGGAKLDAGNSTLGVTSAETDTLVQTNENDWNTPGAQLGVGYVYYFRHAHRYSCHVQWFPSIEPELNLYYLSSNSIDGDVWRFNSSAFNELTYDMPFHSTRLMLDAALTIMSYKHFSAFAIGGIGNAWSRIGYSDKDKSGTCSNQNLSLNSKTNSHFAWELGAGVNYAFNYRFGMSFEYLYTNFGNLSTSGSGTVGTVTTPVITPAHFSLSSQTALLGLNVAV